MKKCVNCNCSIVDDARFCNKCGALQTEIEEERELQGTEKSSKVSVTNPAEDVASLDVPLPIKKETLKQAADAVTRASIEQLHKAAFVALGVIVLSIFIPIFRVIGWMGFTIIDYSKLLSVLICGLCALGYLAVTQKQYAILTVVGQSFIAFLAICFIRYQSIMSDVRRSFLGIVSGRVVTAEWGMYLLVLGGLAASITGAMCGLVSSDKELNGAQVMSKWREYAAQSVKIQGIGLPGFVWSIILAGILFFVASQSIS